MNFMFFFKTLTVEIYMKTVEKNSMEETTGLSIVFLKSVRSHKRFSLQPQCYCWRKTTGNRRELEVWI